MPRKAKKTASLPIVEEKRIEKRTGKFVYEKLSSSMMKTWLSCKRKFYHNYIEGLRSEQTQPLSLGVAVHKALEEANKYLKTHNKVLNHLEVDFYIQVFREYLAKQHIDSSEAFELGEHLLKIELASYGHEKIVGIEEKFDEITPEGVRIYGFIDKLVEEDPNTLRIIDYKTSVMPLSYEESRLDEQLSMYDLAMSIKFPQYENRILELRYIRTDDKNIIRITKSAIEQQNFRRRLLAVDKAIREYVETIKEAPPGELNQFCSWCSWKQSCPTYVTHMNTMLPDFPNVSALDDTSFMDMWAKVALIQSAADAWKEALKLWALQRIEAFPDHPIENGEKQIYTITQSRKEYDPVAIGKLIGLKDLLGGSSGGESLIKINHKALDAYLKNKKSNKLQVAIDKAVTVKFNSPQIRTKKL